MLDIPNNPAGRLRLLLQEFKYAEQTASLGTWWHNIAGSIAPNGGDAYSVRAEAGALFRDVELAIRCLPPQDNREAYLSARGEWAGPIFGWGLNDSEGRIYGTGDLISDNALHWLDSLGSLLRREAPEFTIRAGKEEVTARLEKIYDNLGHILLSLTQFTEIDSEFQFRCSRQILEAMEDITYVRLRGLAPLDIHIRTIENQLEDAEKKSQTSGNQGAVEKFKGLVSSIREILVDLEKIVYPAAIAVTIAISSKDVVAAIAAGAATRKYLEDKAEMKELITATSERLQLTDGSPSDNEQGNVE